MIWLLLGQQDSIDRVAGRRPRSAASAASLGGLRREPSDILDDVLFATSDRMMKEGRCMARHGREGVEESYCTREERRALEAGKCLCVAGGCAGHVPCEQSAIMQPSSRGEWRTQEESGSGEGGHHPWLLRC